MTVMNKVLMEHICDFTSFGKYAEEMNNYGIQIIEVGNDIRYLPFTKKNVIN